MTRLMGGSAEYCNFWGMFKVTTRDNAYPSLVIFIFARSANQSFPFSYRHSMKLRLPEGFASCCRRSSVFQNLLQVLETFSTWESLGHLSRCELFCRKTIETTGMCSMMFRDHNTHDQTEPELPAFCAASERIRKA